MLNNRIDFVLLVDCQFGSLNGDPDMGNMPRIDPDTNLGIVSSVSLKRKVRDYVALLKTDKNGIAESGFDIYVKDGSVLNVTNKMAYDANNLVPESLTLPKDKDDEKAIIQFMCNNFYDIRTFGAVMTTEINCGQVKGPVQFTNAISVEPVYPQEMTITRVAVTTEKEKEKSKSGHTMGTQQYIPYGLYKMAGYISAPLAEKSGFSEDDLSLLFEALQNMFDHSHSAASGVRSFQRLFVFRHESRLGNIQANKLFKAINIKRKNNIDTARSIDDYDITVDQSIIPSNVKFSEIK